MRRASARAADRRYARTPKALAKRRAFKVALRARRAKAKQCRECGAPAAGFRCEVCAAENKERGVYSAEREAA